MKAQKPRGQALALMSLTMLLLVLMVCVTLSFSTRVREKMETQSVADLAAYSSAVATARTFNSIALMNRAANAELVALMANNSLISWTSLVRASLLAAKTSLQNCAPASVKQALAEADADIQEEWDKRDAQAGVQGYNLHQMAWFLASEGGTMLNKQLMEAVDGGPKSFATQLAKLATQGSRYPGELKGGSSAVSVGELTALQGGNPFARDMSLATRGYDFVTRRLVPPPPIDIPDNIKGLEITSTPLGEGGGSGSTYWGDSKPGNNPGHGATPGGRLKTDFLIAEDHATVTVKYPGCPVVTKSARALVRSTDRNDHSDDHNWSLDGAAPKDDLGEEKEFRHTLLPCDDPKDMKICPNVFAGGPSFNNARFQYPEESDKDIWVQPKLFSLVQRDYKVRQAAGAAADPWVLRFDFHFSPSRTSTFDNRGLRTSDGTDISVQSALASGLAYYHRRAHWREPPNLWNPFWRATLVSVDIDETGKKKGADGDVGKTMVGTPGGAAYDALLDAGYKGAH